MNRTTKTLIAGLATAAGAVALQRRRATVSSAASHGVLDPAGVRRLYDRVAPFYDLLTAPYRWIGAGHIADQAIHQLQLQPGDTVVAIETDTEAVAWSLDALVDGAAAVTTGGIDGTPLVILWRAGQSSALDQEDIAAGRDGGTVGVFSAVLDGQALTFRPDAALIED